jgi:hypothetical protein
MKRIIGFSLTAATLAITVAACQSSGSVSVTPGDSTIASPSTTLALATTTVVTLPPAYTNVPTTAQPATTTEASTTTAKPAPATTAKPKTPATTVKPVAPTTTAKAVANNDALFSQVFADLQVIDQKFMDSGDLVAFDRDFGAVKSKYSSKGVKIVVGSAETLKYSVTIGTDTKCRVEDLSQIVPVLVAAPC